MVSMASPVAAADESDERAPDLGLRSSLGSVSVDGKRKRAVRRASIGGGRPPLKGLTADVRKEEHSYYPRRRSSSDGEMPTPTNMSLSGMTYKPKKTTTGARKAAGDEQSHWLEALPLPPSEDTRMRMSSQESTGEGKRWSEKRPSSSSGRRSDAALSSDNDLSVSWLDDSRTKKASSRSSRRK
ncbi:hypothetical protein ACHAXS_001376, partial [Conticribra weissflogii]